MLLRFLLALLLAFGAVPTVAADPACHGDAAPMAMAHHEGTPAPGVATGHLCAGCVPLADWLGDRIAAPILPVAVEPITRTALLFPARTGPPILPPPRIG